MNQIVVRPDLNVSLEGRNHRLWCLGPGVGLEVIEPHLHFLDVHIGGAMGSYRLLGDPGPVAPCPPNSFTFLPAGTERRVAAVRSGITLRAVFPRRRLAAAARPLVLLERLPPVQHAFDAALIGAACLIRDHMVLRREAVTAAERHAFVLMLAVRLAYLLTEARVPPTPVRAGPIQKTIEHIEAHLDEPLLYDHIAALVGVSPYHFARSFREAMNMSLRQYIITRRIARAQDLLLRTADGLADIAYQVGFGSQSHMTTAFRTHLGRTPGEVRSQRKSDLPSMR